MCRSVDRLASVLFCRCIGAFCTLRLVLAFFLFCHVFSSLRLLYNSACCVCSAIILYGFVAAVSTGNREEKSSRTGFFSLFLSFSLRASFRVGTVCSNRQAVDAVDAWGELNTYSFVSHTRQ